MDTHWAYRHKILLWLLSLLNFLEYKLNFEINVISIIRNNQLNFMFSFSGYKPSGYSIFDGVCVL